MKKVFLSAALALAVAGSWAFYPKKPESGEYLMLIGKVTLAEATITSISATGAPQVQSVTKKVNRANILEAEILLQQAELEKLNQLKNNGYKLVTTTTDQSGLGIQHSYILEKQ